MFHFVIVKLVIPVCFFFLVHGFHRLQKKFCTKKDLDKLLSKPEEICQKWVRFVHGTEVFSRQVSRGLRPAGHGSDFVSSRQPKTSKVSCL